MEWQLSLPGIIGRRHGPARHRVLELAFSTNYVGPHQIKFHRDRSSAGFEDAARRTILSTYMLIVFQRTSFIVIPIVPLF
jgi:hypothetical protein